MTSILILQVGLQALRHGRQKERKFEKRRISVKILSNHNVPKVHSLYEAGG